MLSATVDVVSRAASFSASAGGNSVVYPKSISADGRYVAFVSDASNLVNGPTIAVGVKNLYREDRLTGEVVLVSVNATGDMSANADVSEPMMSADGNVISFVTKSTNLVSIDLDSHADVYIRDLTTGTTSLVSVSLLGTSGANQNCDIAILSVDGSTVVYQSTANNLAAIDTNGVGDIFARDLSTGTTHLVSTNLSNTGSADGFSGHPTISANGRMISFESNAGNLTANDNNSDWDVFTRDLSTGMTHLVSINSAGSGSGNAGSGTSSISGDGHVVLYFSRSTNLHPSDTTNDVDLFARNLATGMTQLVSDAPPSNGVFSLPRLSDDGNVVVFSDSRDIYARDLTMGITRLVSVNATGTGGGDQWSSFSSMSADGNVIAFTSAATNLHPLDTEIGSASDYDIFVRDMAPGVTRLVSVNASGISAGNAPSAGGYVSADGSVVTFTTTASDIVANDLNGFNDVFAIDLTGGNMQLLSQHGSGLESVTANGESDFYQGKISADGRYVAFVSSAPNLVNGLHFDAGIANVYRFDRVTGQVELVSVNSAGTGGGNAGSFEVSISADGNKIAFRSGASDLNALDQQDHGYHIYVRNMLTQTTDLVSINEFGTGGGYAYSLNPVISADGGTVAFVSRSRYLDPLDNNTTYDVYARNLITGTTKLVSVNAAGTGRGNGVSQSPDISADGSVVTFWSEAGNLHPLDTDSDGDVFARNLITNTTYLVSVNSTGTGSGNYESGSPHISADGNVIAFSSSATNLSELDTDRGRDIYARNIATGTTYLVTVNVEGSAGTNAEVTNIMISADGNVVAFGSNSNNLSPLDTQISGGSSNRDVFARILATGVTYLVSVNASGTAVTTNDAGDHWNVFIRDIVAGTTQLISVNSDRSGGGNGDSVYAAISADGSVVAFGSDATDLVDHDWNSESDVFIGVVSAATPQLVGDYNSDGTVDSADYTVWRKTSGTVVAPYTGADGSGNGIIGQEDYRMWRAHFGQSLAPSATVIGSQLAKRVEKVIEPTNPQADAGVEVNASAPRQTSFNVAAISASILARSGVHTSPTHRDAMRGGEVVGRPHRDAVLANWFAASQRDQFSGQRELSEDGTTDFDEHAAEYTRRDVDGQELRDCLYDWSAFATSGTA